MLSFAMCAKKRSACWRNCRRFDCKKQKNAELCFPAELPGVTKGGQHLPPSNDTGNGFECQQPPPRSSPSGWLPPRCLTRDRTLSLQKLPRCTFWQLVSPARCYQLMGRQWRRAPRRSRGGAPPLQRIVESSHGAAGSCHKLLIHHLKLLEHHHYQDLLPLSHPILSWCRFTAVEYWFFQTFPLHEWVFHVDCFQLLVVFPFVLTNPHQQVPTSNPFFSRWTLLI